MTVRPGWTGRCYEDFAVGDVYRHPLGRTIGEADNAWFTLLTMNTAPAHFDTRVAELSGHPALLVNSCLTLSIVVGESVTDLTQNGVFNLAWDAVQLVRPVYVGDTLYAESQVIGKRESASRPSAGIVTTRTRGLNQRGETVITFSRTFMVNKRSAERVEPPPALEPWPAIDMEGRAT